MLLIAAVAAIVAVGLTVGTAQWHDQADAHHRAATEARAATIGAQAASVGLGAALGQLTTRTADLQHLIDTETAQLADAVTGRDLVRSALARTRDDLVALQDQLNGTFALVLAQGDTLAQLDTCLGGVGKALNLIALDDDRAADEALLASHTACQQAQAAVLAARSARR